MTFEIAAIPEVITGLPTGQIQFANNVTLANQDYIYDADNGMFIGRITSSGGGTASTFSLVGDGHLTQNGSAPTNAVKVTLPTATIKGRAKQDTFDKTDDKAYHPLKCVVFPDYSTYDGLTIPTDTELILPLDFTTSQLTSISGHEGGELTPLKNVVNGGGLMGMIGVSLDRYDVEDGKAFELEEGDTTQVLKENTTVVAGSETHLAVKSDKHFKELQSVNDSGSPTTSAPFPVDGSYMVFKPRLWTGSSASGKGN